MEATQKIPLAEKMRPKNLDEVIGQQHLLRKDGILRKIVVKKDPVSLIFWGPAGVGKTTLSRIIAQEMEADFIELSAVSSGKKDIERIIEQAKQNWNLNIRTILFVDEIHRFNKSQQDAFLPHIESGLISLIGATTENPAFEIINPLISRSRVLTLNSLSNSDIKKIISNAIIKVSPKTQISDTALTLLSKMSNGDARMALGNLELILSVNSGNKITPEIIKDLIYKSSLQYDKHGDNHYDSISAFIKSMRAGEAEAACYYLAKMLESGEDPKYIARRMIIFASEDIGLAGNGALGLANAAFDAIIKLGMPEARYPLFHTAIALSKSKKSREVAGAIYQSLDLVKNNPAAQIPLHLRNSTSEITKELGYTKDYEWTAGFKHKNDYLPEEVRIYKINNKNNQNLKNGNWSREIHDNLIKKQK